MGSDSSMSVNDLKLKIQRYIREELDALDSAVKSQEHLGSIKQRIIQIEDFMGLIRTIERWEEAS